MAAGTPRLAVRTAGGDDHRGDPGRAPVRGVRRWLGHRVPDRVRVRREMDRDRRGHHDRRAGDSLGGHPPWAGSERFLPGTARGQPLRDRPGQSHRGAPVDRDRRRRLHRPVRLHHRPEPLLRRPGHPDRAAVAEQHGRLHRPGKLARCGRDRFAWRMYRPERGGGRGLGGARPGARPMRGRGGPGQGRPRVLGRRRMGTAIPGTGRTCLITQETGHVSVTMGAAAVIGGGESDIEVAAQPGVSIRAAWPESPRGHVEGSSDLVASAAYQPEPAAVAAARRFVRETLQSWLPAEQAPAGSGLVDDAVLLTSELVTNAVVHAGTPVHVTCKLADGGLEVMVRDSLPASMVLGRAQDENILTERTSGRGLLLPSALASAWGVTYGRAAKAVWFRMGLASAREDGSGDSAASQPAAGQSSAGQSSAGQSSAGQSSIGQRGPERSMGSGYDELLARTVESARAALAADAAYVLMPDEDGDLRVRAVAGARSAELLAAPPSVLTAGFLVADQVTGVLAVAGALPAQFAKGAAGQLQQLADQVAAPLERSRLADIELRRKARAGVAAEASDLLAGPADQDAILALAGRAVVPRLAAWCAVLLAQPDGTLQVAYVQHAEESRCAALSWVAGRACPVAPWDPHQRAGRPGPAQAWLLATADLS